MENSAKCIERDGSKTIDLDFMHGVYRDHFYSYVDADGRIYMEVDDYHPDIEDRWDPSEWEEHKCFISGPATRCHWKIIYRIGRALERHGKITLHQDGHEPLAIACDGCEVIFN